MKKILFGIIAAGILAMSACAAKKGEETAGQQKETSILVAYFSAQGHTKSLAEKVADATGGDLFEIQPVNPYTEEDLDGWNDSARGAKESKDRTTRPGVAYKVENFEKYDTIYLGFQSGGLPLRL